MRLDEILAQFVQYGFITEKFAGIVIHHEDVDSVVHCPTPDGALELLRGRLSRALGKS